MRLGLRYSLAFGVPLVSALMMTPVARRLASRLGLIDHPKTDRHHQQSTPYLGGLAIAAGLVLVGANAGGASGQMLTILLCAVAVAGLGLADDWIGRMNPVVKLLVEASAGVALWMGGVSAGIFGVPVLDLLVTVLWVVAVTNAINLLDNMDGLASGVAAIAATTYFVVAASRGEYLVGSLALAIAGGSLGFLCYNFPPARIFLGDAGSLLLGFLLAALALKMDLVGESGLLRTVVPALILGVPLFDTTLVILARRRDGRHVYIGGTDHSSHRLATRGLSGRAVALLTYGAQIVCCLMAVSLLHARTEVGIVIVVGMAVAATAGLWFFLAMPHPVAATGGGDTSDLEVRLADTSLRLARTNGQHHGDAPQHERGQGAHEVGEGVPGIQGPVEEVALKELDDGAQDDRSQHDGGTGPRKTSVPATRSPYGSE